MAFPTTPTTAANTLIPSVQGTATTTHTFGSLTTLDNAAGDLLIAVIVLYQASATGNAFSAWGGGFNEFGDSSSAVNPSMAMGCAYKISDGTETGTFTVTSSISGRSAMFLMSVKNWHGSTIPEAAFSAETTTTAQDPPNLDPAGWGAEDTLWIAVAAGGQTSLTGSWGGITSAPASYTDYAESSIAGGDVVGACQIAVAFRANNVTAENPGSFTTDTSPEIERAATIAVRPAVATSPNAENVAITATAEAPAASIAPNAGGVAITATAEAPTASIAPNAELVAVTATAEAPSTSVTFTAELVAVAGAAETPTPSVAPNAEAAEVTAAALDATVETTVGTNVDAECAEATGTAEAASVSVAANAEAVAVAASAESPTTSVDANAEAVAVAAAAETPAASVDVSAELVTASGAAEDPATAVTVNVEAVTVGATAPDPTVETTGATNAQAECAEATAEALSGSASVAASAEAAAAAATVDNALAAVEVLAEAVSIVAAAFDATIEIGGAGTNALAECATATGSAFAGKVRTSVPSAAVNLIEASAPVHTASGPGVVVVPRAVPRVTQRTEAE